MCKLILVKCIRKWTELTGESSLVCRSCFSAHWSFFLFHTDWTCETFIASGSCCQGYSVMCYNINWGFIQLYFSKRLEFYPVRIRCTESFEMEKLYTHAETFFSSHQWNSGKFMLMYPFSSLLWILFLFQGIMHGI